MLRSADSKVCLRARVPTPVLSTSPQSTLRFKGEASANLVGGLVRLLGIERSTNTEGDALAEKDVIGKGSDATVVNLGLCVC